MRVSAIPSNGQLVYLRTISSISGDKAVEGPQRMFLEHMRQEAKFLIRIYELCFTMNTAEEVLHIRILLVGSTTALASVWLRRPTIQHHCKLASTSTHFVQMHMTVSPCSVFRYIIKHAVCEWA